MMQREVGVRVYSKLLDQTRTVLHVSKEHIRTCAELRDRFQLSKQT